MTHPTIESRPGLTPAEREAVDALYAACAAADGVDLKLAYETAPAADPGATTCAVALAGSEVVGFVSIDSGTTVEITGMVHPGHRRQGAGRGLLAAALGEVARRRSEGALLIVEEGCASGQGFVRDAGWPAHSREHRMELDLAGWAPRAPVQVDLAEVDASEAEAYVRVAAEAFGEDPAELRERTTRSLDDPHERSYIVSDRTTGVPLGVGRLVDIGHRAGVYGFAVIPSARGHGVGGQMLDAILARAVAAGHIGALLEVEPDNEPAVRLYRSRGFVVRRTYGYYSAPGWDPLS